MADPLTYANSDEYVLVNPSDPKVGHLIYDAPMVDAETKQFIRDSKTGKIKVYRMVIWGTKGLTQAQVEALITQKNATLVTRINNLDSTLTNFLDADDTSLDQLSELVAAIKANKIDIASLVTDIGKLIDPVSHMPIKATANTVGVVQLATAQDVKDGTANKVVDAKELINFAQTLPAVNGVTDVSSGDNSNQLVVSRIGGSKTLTIDNVEHAGSADEATHASQADTAASANSVAWDKVSGKPSSYTPSSHTHDDRYYTESEIDTKLDGKANTSGALFTVNGITKPGWSAIGTGKGGSCIQVKTTDNTYPSICFHRSGYSYCVLAESGGQLGTMHEGDETFNYLITSANIGSQSVNYANSAGSVAWSNVSGKPTKVSQFTNDSGYITGITKAMVTNALGYTPPTSDTNTHYTTTLYAGAKNAKSNAATTNGNTYIKLYDDSTVRSQLNIKGSGATSVTTDANGVITISSTDTNTWNALKGSTASAAGTAGYAPAPAAGAANRYLRCDGTWQVPPDNNTTYSNMTAATASAAGKAGLVPAPGAGKQTSFLRGDGTWVVPTNTTYSVATTSANGLMSSSDKTKLNKCVTTDSIWVG